MYYLQGIYGGDEVRQGATLGRFVFPFGCGVSQAALFPGLLQYIWGRSLAFCQLMYGLAPWRHSLSIGCRHKPIMSATLS